MKLPPSELGGRQIGRSSLLDRRERIETSMLCAKPATNSCSSLLDRRERIETCQQTLPAPCKRFLLLDRRERIEGHAIHSITFLPPRQEGED